MRLIPFVLSLGVGEAIASRWFNIACMWPVWGILTMLVLCFGYGYALRGWKILFFLILGMTLHFASTAHMVANHRERPWMIGRRCRQYKQGPFPQVKKEFSRRLAIGLEHSPETVMLNRAILLGERAKLPYATKRRFIDSGTIHIFAISGLHVMVVARLLMFLMALFFVPLRFQGVLSLLPMWGYVVMIGSPPSAVRAAIMASCYFIAPMVWRRSDALTSWSIAFLLLHIVNPLVITNVGSQLSFAIMLALVLASQVVRGLGTIWMQSLVMTFVAWLAGVPISACVFGRIAPGGILANLVLVGAASWSVTTSAMGILVSYGSTTIAAHLNNFSALCTDAMAGIAALVASLPGSSFEIERWTTSMCLETYIVFALVFYLICLIQQRHNML